MKFYCEKSEIASTISQVAKILSSKPAIPALEGIYMEAVGDTCKLTSGNGQLTLTASFKADIKEEGFALVPGRVFHEIIRRCYDGDVEISTDNAMTIVSGKSRVTIGIMNPDIYPNIKPGDELFKFSMENAAFKDAVRGSIFCAAGDNYTKPIFTGVYIEKNDEDISFVSIDGCRVAIKNSTSNGDNGVLLVPAKALDLISACIGDEEKTSFTVYSSYLKVEWQGLTIISTLLNKDEYVNYKDIIPKEHNIKIKVERIKLLSSVERASVLSRIKQNNLLIFDIESDVLNVSAKSDIGDSSDDIDIWQEGEPIRIGFNGGFLSDCLRSIDDEFIYIEFEGPRNPCIIKPCEGNEYLYMILPIQIN